MRKNILLLILCVGLLISGCTGNSGKATNDLSQLTQTTGTTETIGDNSTMEETGSTQTMPIQTDPLDTDEADSSQPEKETVDVSPSTTTTPETKPTEPPETTEHATQTTTPTTPAEVPTTPSVDTTPTNPPAKEVNASMTQQTYNGLNYWLYTPANPTANMPLIVYLHGGSGKGEDLNLLTDVDGFPQYVKDGRISCNAYIIFPQCPSSQKGWKTMGGKIEALINYTCSTYDLDTNRVSLTGHSMGGTGTWTLALDRPELFYKIAPMSGSVTVSDSSLEKLSAIPVWAVVGDQDKIVSPDTSIAMVDALKQNGADATITVLEGATHFDVPGLGYLSTDVVNWLIT